MARFMVKASEYKNVCKAVNDRKLAELKKEIIEILKKQDEKEFKKAVDLFESQEMHYSHLEKSITGKWVEKAGYGVGTVRIWKGKKYKKIAPGKWARVFEKEGRGANVSIGRLIAEVDKIQTIEKLYEFAMAHKQRFVDDNGIDLPILDKLRAKVDSKNKELSNGGMGSKETSKPAEKNSLSDKDKKMMKDFDLSESDYLYLKDKVFNELNPDKDGIKTGVSIQGLAGELYKKDNRFKKLVDKIEAQRPGSSRFYGDFMYNLKNNENQVESKKPAEKKLLKDKEYEYYKNNLSTEDDLENISKDIKKEREYLNNRKDKPGVEQRLKELNAKEKVVNELLEEKKNKPAEKKELSMNEKVLIATDEGSKKELGRGKMYKKHITEIQKIANSNINDIPENLKTINDFVKYQDSLDNPDYKQAGKDYARLKNHELAREIWQKVEDGEAEWDENGYLKLDENGLLAKPEKKEESKQKTLSEKIKVSEELSNNHQKAVEKVIEEVKKELGAEKTERGLTYKNSYSGDFKNYKGGGLGRSYHSMINGASKVESDYNGKPINYLTHDIEWSNSKNIDEYIDKLQERYDKKLKERKEHGIWNTNHAYWGEILEDAIKLQALKDIRDNELLLTKEEINSYEDEIKAESERKEKESKRINTVIDYYEEESETNPNLDKKELVKIYDAIENGKDTSKFNQHDVEGMAAFMGVDLKKVKKSFDDQFLLDMAVEDEIQKVEEEQEEESLFDDYSAEQPELFNSTTMKVQEAFNRCKVL